MLPSRLLVTGLILWVAVAADAQPTVLRGVWYIDGRIASRVRVDDPNNELLIDRGEIVLALADGQRERLLPERVTSIHYYRNFERPPLFGYGGELIPLVVPGAGLFHKSTNHFVDLTFTLDDGSPSTLRLRLDKKIFQRALEDLQRVTTRPILVSAEDAKGLPATLRTELTTIKAAPPTRSTREWSPTGALRMAVDADARILAAILRDGSVQVWDLATGAAGRRWQAVEPTHQSWIAVAPRGDLVVTSSPRTGIQQWASRSGERLGDAISAVALETLPSRPAMPFWLQPDGTRLIVGSDGSCWAMNNATPVPCPQPYAQALFSKPRWPNAAFSASGAQLVVSDTRYLTPDDAVLEVTVWEWPNGTLVRRTVFDGVPDVVGFVDTESVVVLAGYFPSRLGRFRLGAGAPVRLWQRKIAEEYGTVAVSPQLIAGGGTRRELLLISTATGRIQATLPTSSWTSALLWLPDGRLAAAAEDGTVSIWDTTTRQVSQVLQLAPVQ